MSQIIMKHLEDDISSFFEELNGLKESGEINMFGAPKWLRDNYDLSKDQWVLLLFSS